jgi:hypothetical protein
VRKPQNEAMKLTRFSLAEDRTVSEDQTRPWPPVSGKERSYMATYRAAVGAGRLRLWFEADGHPVTTIAEVPLQT